MQLAEIVVSTLYPGCPEEERVVNEVATFTHSLLGMMASCLLLRRRLHSPLTLRRKAVWRKAVWRPLQLPPLACPHVNNLSSGKG